MDGIDLTGITPLDKEVDLSGIKATTQDEVAKKKSTHFYIECGRWYIHIGIRTED